MANSLYQSINTLWQFMQMDHQPQEADCIFCMCSNDPRVAEYAAKLHLEGYAPELVFSGGVGRFTEGLFDNSEAEAFADIAMDLGVPEHAILIENKSSNSGENVLFTAALFDKLDYKPQRFILVQKPYMVRRAYATFKKQWPYPINEVCSTGPKIRFSDYFNEALPSDLVITALLQDFERVKAYPAKGFQIEQAVPEHVQSAYERLSVAFPLL